MSTHSKDALIRIGDASGSASRTSGTTGMSDLTESSNITVDTSGGSTEITQLGDDAIRRLAGRADFNVSTDVFLDLTLAQHQDLVLSPIEDREWIVHVIPDVNSGAVDSRTGLVSRCLVDTDDVSVPGDDAVTQSVSFVNADGQVWTIESDL